VAARDDSRHGDKPRRTSYTRWRTNVAPHASDVMAAAPRRSCPGLDTQDVSIDRIGDETDHGQHRST
jgi:hypothetical protein